MSDELQVHPLAELFPAMAGADLDALIADIREHGLHEPIVLHENQILDGRNRYRACKSASVEPRFVEWDQRGSIQAFVVSKNLHRRHLNESQRALIAARLANVEHGQNGRTIEDTQITVSTAAKLLNVSAASVTEAKTVLKSGTPQEIEAVEAGRAAVGTLGRQIRGKMPKERRAKERARPLSETGKNPERIQRQQINAEIWGRVRDALVNLTSLPVPSDAAAIARTNDKTGMVDQRLPKAISWLKDFSDAWRTNG